MASKLIWFVYAADYTFRNKLPLYKIKYCKRKYISIDEGSSQLTRLINSGECFMLGRIGLFEAAAMRMYEFKKTNKYSLVMNNIYNCAGFFPNDINLGGRFLQLMKDSLKETDFLAANNQLCENYFINHFMPEKSTVIRDFGIFDVCKLKNSWTKALKGKKVLVVTSFPDTVKMQYEKRAMLFPGDEEILPEFELKIYQPLMTVGDMKDPRFNNWFEALEFMEKEILSIDFDIALLACGAYGFPLAAAIKKTNKSAIYMGGAMQILFGIMGKRWDGTRQGGSVKIRDDIAKFYNDNWTYPIEEKPAEASKVEYGPYWK